MSKKDRFKLKGHTIAGTFRVDEVVAEGGFGVVYRAFHLHFRSPVALKCLKIPTELSEEERLRFLEQFRSEAEIQFRLSAALPHIVRPLHVDAVHTESGEFVPLMALEWLEGRTFEKIIERRAFSDQPPLSLIEAVNLIGPAAQALHQAHNFRVGEEILTVVHRDIKPDNLFVTTIGGKEVVKILDFGISKVRRAASHLAGHFSQTSGTAPFSPAYGAPEQWVPKRFGQTGPWTDVWGLALTLVEIIKGDAVIVGDHQAMMGTVLDPKVRPTPRAEGVQVSDEVESVFEKALSLDPRYRYQSIEAFWESLQGAIDYSGDLAQRYDETPSGSRIPLPKMSAPTPWAAPRSASKKSAQPFAGLPPMMAPALLSLTAQEDLAEVERVGAASYPINPHSDLKPVPAAPTSWDHFDPDIPPSSVDSDEDDDFEDLRPDALTPNLPGVIAALRANGEPPPSTLPFPEKLEVAAVSERPPSFSLMGNLDIERVREEEPPSLGLEMESLSEALPPPVSRREPSIKLELEPTSNFPRSTRTEEPAPILPPSQPPIPDLAVSPPAPVQKTRASKRLNPPPRPQISHPPTKGAPSRQPPDLIPAAVSGRPPPPSLRASRPGVTGPPPAPQRSQRPPPPKREEVRVSGGPPPPPSHKPAPRPAARETEEPTATEKTSLKVIPSGRSRSAGS